MDTLSELKDLKNRGYETHEISVVTGYTEEELKKGGIDNINGD